MYERVRFRNGFECARKHYKPRRKDPYLAAKLSLKEWSMQRRVAGVAPTAYHRRVHANGTLAYLFSELMVSSAWDVEPVSSGGVRTPPLVPTPACPTAAHAQYVDSTCTEMDRAMSALDAAGVFHRDLKLEHFMRNARGEMRVVDFTAAIALDPSDPCLRGANRELFVEQNACFHAPLIPGVSRTAMPSSLTEVVERSASSFDGNTFVVNKANVGPVALVETAPPLYKCFAQRCFPLLVESVKRMHRERGALKQEDCLAKLRAINPI